ncbi:fimbria/pilus outer membrane usher protein [Ramlibacter sp. MMS24-I3-19]|uniref:fimbria/pilus outer membrane usher protein n=1 Tax=Ramlibacter sp. MMS24-I3-19 TaxID=3416606 RepID=UPI003D071774
MWTQRTAPDLGADSKRRTARHHRSCCFLFSALLAAASPLTFAQQDLGAIERPAGDEVFVTLRINGVTRGEFLALKTGDDFWLSGDDLARLNMTFPGGKPGKRYNSLRELGASTLDFNEGELVLAATFPADALEATRVDLGTLPQAPRLTASPSSLILSYRLSHRTLPTVGQQTTALTDLNVRMGEVLLRQESRVDSGDLQRGFTRGRTQAIVDEPAQARRWIAGDVLSSAGPYGTAITGAGLQVAKVWNMAPDSVRQTRGSIRTTTALPAQVELTVDGTTVYRGDVGPGPVEFNNLQFAGGQRDLRLIVTDVSGRRTVVDQPFFFADTALAAGVHDYAYFVGKRSELGTRNQWQYKEAAAQAFHRYGLNDRVTIGVGGEANADFASIGSGATLRTETLGLFSLDRLANRDRVEGRTRTGWSGRYTFQTPLFTAIGGLRVFDRQFRSFSTASDAAFPTRDTRFSLSRAVGSTSVSVEWARTQTDTETRMTAALRLYRSLGNSSLVSAELRTTQLDGQRQNGIGVVYRKYLDQGQWAGGSVDLTGSTRTSSVEVGRQTPQDEGVGYRALLSDISQPGRDSQAAALVSTLNLRPATLELTTTSENGGGGTYGELALTGAMVAVDSHIGLSRQVNDSFLLARLGVPQPGVQILLNNQVQGTTDTDGQLFIPNVAAFDRQDLSVNDKQVPITYQLGRRSIVVAPQYRSGAIVDFGMRKQRGLAGKAWNVRGGRRSPLGGQAWTMRGPSGAFTIESSSTGDFYVEDAAPGTYTGHVTTAGQDLSCKLRVPVSSEPVVELSEGVLCE